jgi:hypothetical protein
MVNFLVTDTFKVLPIVLIRFNIVAASLVGLQGVKLGLLVFDFPRYSSIDTTAFLFVILIEQVGEGIIPEVVLDVVEFPSDESA